MYWVSRARLGLTPEEFWHEIDPGELHQMYKTLNDVIEFNQRFELGKMRLQTMLLLNIQLKPHQQFKSPQKLMKFYWEEVSSDEVEIYDEEQWDAIDKKIGLKEEGV